MIALRTIALVGLSGLVLAQSRSALADGPAVERSVMDMSPSKGQNFTELVIDNSLGDVRVEGHDSTDLVIMARKRAPDRQTMDRVKVSLVPDPRGPVAVHTRLVAGPEARPVPAGTVRVDLVIRAPRDAVVRVRTWNGKAAVEGVDNGADLSVNEGDITVHRVIGQVRTTSAQGEQELGQVVGTVSAKSLYGDIELDWIRGHQVSATVHQGEIRARRIESRVVDLRVVRGDVHLHISPTPLSDVRVRALRGNVEVVSEGSSPLEVDAEVRKGRVTLPRVLAPAQQGFVWSGKTGVGARGRVSIRTGLGDVVFSMAPQPASQPPSQ